MILFFHFNNSDRICQYTKISFTQKSRIFLYPRGDCTSRNFPDFILFLIYILQTIF